jgi:hypothetical protein
VLQCSLTQRYALGAQGSLNVLEAADEAADGHAQRILGRRIEETPEVGQGEEDITQLVLDGVAVSRGDGLVQLVQLLLELGAHAGGVRPVEPDAAGLLGEPLGA